MPPPGFSFYNSSDIYYLENNNDNDTESSSFQNPNSIPDSDNDNNNDNNNNNNINNNTNRSDPRVYNDRSYCIAFLVSIVSDRFYGSCDD